MEDIQGGDAGISAPGKKVRRAVFPVLDRNFQVRVTLIFVLIILLSHLLLLALHYRSLNRSTAGAIGMTGTQLELYLSKQRREWTRDLMLGVSGIVLTVGVVVFYLTQKVSGPLYAMSKVLDDVARGNASERVALRRNDEFKWFADKLNETLDILQNQNKK